MDASGSRSDDGYPPIDINDLYHEMADRVKLEHLDLICEALGCELSDLIVREPNSEPRTMSRRGAPIHNKQ